ncbi:hypothetical protein M409DRAFT_64459 [Zasmidium cellare ATCC 36951]|uniref:Cryptic loci regulator 2 N-terminal domain-containing protein n=1 Tax=Zasmidium cellare ATCC 36951 TaxID=1080233 RepID=A0A6A6CSG1_ZASCE|nr:uncharacterized protein M409DRAFT_64459 [Zasmidium cellare ATCC 36951]KAF2170094.1 hypothetical protein M409DRAFT_64459 [Zasmidium cellare ATCC 36951]
MASVQIVDVVPSSDGTGAQPGVAAMVRNDTYFLEKLADRWMKERGDQLPGVTYKLARLPTGFAGFERQRDGSKHVDRYLYGHPNGVFRSLNEIYPHFKYLQDYHGTIGCPCKLCTGIGKGKRKSESNSIVSGSQSERSTHFGTSSSKSAIRKDNPQGLPQGRLDSDSPAPARGNPVDEEGTPDVYRKLLDRLSEAGSNGISENIIDQLSPDWRAGNEELQSLLTDWQSQPAYVPRMGEVVLFARSVSNGEAIAWDASTQTLRRTDPDSRSWLDRLKWEAGVVTQLPVEPVGSDDLSEVPKSKKQNVAYTGFRIEPLSEPSNDYKPHSKQHKYVPLHAIRPFSFWKECMGGLPEQDWHATVRHTLATAGSFSLIGKYSFKGVWPEATLFIRGVYLGPEFIMVGDVVRLSPTESKRPVTDVMVISSIRLRFVNLDQASENDYDNGRPYMTCLHVCGRAFTLDPKKSSDGIAKSPAKPGEHGLPAWFKSYGQWFHAVDCGDVKAKLEVPYHRVIGRCLEDSAVKAWFSTPTDMVAPSSFQAVNSTPATKFRASDISQCLEGVQEARRYSRDHDARIDRAAGKSWYWAETRIEQLDLHEVNNAFVGVKDEERSQKQVNARRQALKVLDGKKGGLEEYHAARHQRLEEQKRRESAQVGSSAWGNMASAVQADSMDAESGGNDDMMEEDVVDDKGVEGDATEGDAMEVEDELEHQLEREQVPRGFHMHGGVVDLTDELDEDDEMYD